MGLDYSFLHKKHVEKNIRESMESDAEAAEKDLHDVF